MKISGLKDHPDREKLRHDYDRNPPPGYYTAILEAHAWGDNANLFNYFYDDERDYAFRISTWRNHDYRPSADGPPLDEEAVGNVFLLEVDATRNGTPLLLIAECVLRIAEEEQYAQSLETHYDQQRAGRNNPYQGPEKGVFFWPSGAPPLKAR